MAFLRPDLDEVDGNWTNQAGSNVDLFESVNENTADDLDYIQSPADPVNEVCKIRLSDPAGSLAEPFVLRYRFNNSAGVELTVRLMQGTTEIASWVETATGWTTQPRTLSTAQFAAITDFTNLFVELKANVPGPSFADIFGTDLVAWYDASDAASITHSSGAVSQWNDLSGNGTHVTQAVSVNQPVYSTTGLGGTKPSLFFPSGTYRYLFSGLTAAAPGATSAYTFFMVGVLGTGAGPNTRFFGYLGNGNTADYLDNGSVAAIIRDGSNAGFGAYKSNSARGNKAVSLDTPARVVSLFDGVNHTMYVNESAGTPVATAIAIGATGQILIGADNTGNAGCIGHISELAFVKRAATAPELASVAASIAAKWT